MSKRIVLSGGGTGGHLYPLVAVADYLQKRNDGENFEFIFLGPNDQMEKEVMEKHGIPTKEIQCGKLRRYFSFRYFIDFLRFPVGFFQSLWYLWRIMPDAIFAKGGYASVPVVLAAKLYRIPVLVHESDAYAGLANRFLGSLADRIALNFERAIIHFPPSRAIVTGIPINSEMNQGDKSAARKFLGLEDNGKPVIFFIGGSQGARVINELVVDSLPELLAKYQVVHQTGKKNYDQVVALLKEKGLEKEKLDYRPYPFLGSELKDIFALADVVVSRAGATSIAELASNRKPTILVPITASANNHQRLNAYEIAKAGGAIVLEEDNFKKGMLLHNLEEIFFKSELKDKLAENIAKFYHPDATEKIVQELVSLVK